MMLMMDMDMEHTFGGIEVRREAGEQSWKLGAVGQRKRHIYIRSDANDEWRWR